MTVYMRRAATTCATKTFAIDPYPPSADLLLDHLVGDASGVGGTSIPRVRAVCRLITSSNLVGRITGRSEGCETRLKSGHFASAPAIIAFYSAAATLGPPGRCGPAPDTSSSCG